MESVVFNVSERNEKGKKVRMHGEVPAVLYGSHLDNTVSIKITRKDMYKLLTLAKSSILSLKLNGHIENCVVKELQKDSFGKVIHIDFQDIKKDEKIKMKIPVVFDGQSTLEGRQLLLEVLISEVELYGKTDISFTCSSRGSRYYELRKYKNYISPQDIEKIYLPLGFNHFKLEGRQMNDLELIEVLVDYLIKDEYKLEVRSNLQTVNHPLS